MFSQEDFKKWKDSFPLSKVEYHIGSGLIRIHFKPGTSLEKIEYLSLIKYEVVWRKREKIIKTSLIFLNPQLNHKTLIIEADGDMLKGSDEAIITILDEEEGKVRWEEIQNAA